jgi:hypothetical protein
VGTDAANKKPLQSGEGCAKELRQDGKGTVGNLLVRRELPVGGLVDVEGQVDAHGSGLAADGRRGKAVLVDGLEYVLVEIVAGGLEDMHLGGLAGGIDDQADFSGALVAGLCPLPIHLAGNLGGVNEARRNNAGRDADLVGVSGGGGAGRGGGLRVQKCGGQGEGGGE